MRFEPDFIILRFCFLRLWRTFCSKLCAEVRLCFLVIGAFGPSGCSWSLRWFANSRFSELRTKSCVLLSAPPLINSVSYLSVALRADWPINPISCTLRFRITIWLSCERSSFGWMAPVERVIRGPFKKKIQTTWTSLDEAFFRLTWWVNIASSSWKAITASCRCWGWGFLCRLPRRWQPREFPRSLTSIGGGNPNTRYLIAVLSHCSEVYKCQCRPETLGKYAGAHRLVAYAHRLEITLEQR